MSRHPTVLLFLCFLLLFSACSQNRGSETQLKIAETAADIRPGIYPEEDLVAIERLHSQASYTFSCSSVEDLVTAQWLDTAFVVEFLTPGQYETIEDGGFLETPSGNTIDLREYAAETQVKVLEVLKGDPGLVGQTVTAGEKMYWTRSDDDPAFSRFFCDSSMTRAILCTHRASSGAYICTTPEWQIIKINDDDSLEIWPFLENAETYGTLPAFRTMAEEQLAAQANTYAINSANPNATSILLTQAQKTTLTEMLNDPQNNGLLRAEYDTFPEIDLDEALILTSLPTDEVTGSECAAYAAQTGQAAGTLLKISNAALSAYLQEKFGAAPDAFETFTWVYLEAYDAWYHAPYTSEPLQVTVTSGTVTGDEQYLIRYSFTRDGRIVHGTMVYNDLGNLSWYESNVYR